jgi:hypothetical protein
MLMRMKVEEEEAVNECLWDLHFLPPGPLEEDLRLEVVVVEDLLDDRRRYRYCLGHQIRIPREATRGYHHP